MLNIIDKLWTTVLVITCLTGVWWWTPRVIEVIEDVAAMLRSSPSLRPATGETNEKLPE